MRNFCLALLLLPVTLCSQVTLNVTSIPSNTPANATIYLAGNVNSWSPNDPYFSLTNLGNGNFQIVFPEGSGTVEYKFTRGAWSNVEGNATGNFLPNRSFTFTGSSQTLNLTIQSWEDLGGVPQSTASSNVSILDANFYIPQLGVTRRIWLYLPPDYATSQKHYPVLYMHDGQNVFDAATSFSGEWGVDETLNSLFTNGDHGAIVVAVDNGGASRLDEYSPWINTTYGGGDGEVYSQFLAETLKPFIDANYRTRPEPRFNALIGSSMGALISTYGSIEYGDVFQKIGSMSPAYWFAFSDLQNYISSAASLDNHRIYFVAGTTESATMTSHIDAVYNSMVSRGLSPDNALRVFRANGTHTEGFWRNEFAAMYEWLFLNETLSVAGNVIRTVDVRQLNSGQIEVSGLEFETQFSIYNVAGSHVGDIRLTNGTNQFVDELPRGVYILKSRMLPMAPIRIVR